jgi:hypothetical protein
MMAKDVNIKITFEQFLDKLAAMSGVQLTPAQKEIARLVCDGKKLTINIAPPVYFPTREELKLHEQNKKSTD